MILIVAPETDLHARCVAKHLSDMGAQVHILDLGLLADSAEISHFVAAKPGSKVTMSFPHAGHLDLAEVHTVWYRRPRLPKLSHLLPFEADRAFALAEWSAALNGVIASLGARFVNDPTSQRGASKPRQLQVAKQVGLAIPETLITNNAREARRFVERFCSRVVHKALTAPPDRFLATKRWSEADGAALEHLGLAPTIFQEEIQGSLDLRITVIGERLFAAGFPPTKLKNAGDNWIDNRLTLEVPYREHVLPSSVKTRILAIMTGLGLSFGTIDMKINKSDDYVFLEVNPQGQFLYVEILTGLPLARAMAEFLLPQ
jgi:glutathione synthase/RimK-type ligase-like ATP-grasp enzyme